MRSLYHVPPSALTLLNGWSNSGGGLQTAAWGVHGGCAYVRGVITGGTTTAGIQLAEAFDAPPPPATMYFIANCAGSSGLVHPTLAVSRGSGKANLGIADSGVANNGHLAFYFMWPVEQVP